MSVSLLSETSVKTFQYLLERRAGDYFDNISKDLGVSKSSLSRTLTALEKAELAYHKWDEVEIRGKSGYRKRYVVNPEKAQNFMRLAGLTL